MAAGKYQLSERHGGALPQAGIRIVMLDSGNRDIRLGCRHARKLMNEERELLAKYRPEFHYPKADADR